MDDCMETPVFFLWSTVLAFDRIDRIIGPYGLPA